MKLLFLSKRGPTKGSLPANWSIQFGRLWQLSELEQAQLRKTQADADVAYVNAGVLSTTEVAESRFGGDLYSTETRLRASTPRDSPPLEAPGRAETSRSVSGYRRSGIARRWGA